MAPDEKLDFKRDEPNVQSDVQPVGPVSVSVEERRLVRKLDRRILPITCLMYLFSCQCLERSMSALFAHPQQPLDLDRSNLGNARLQGLAKDVLGGDPSGKRFDWVNSIFFLSYVGFHICKSHRRDLHWIWLDFVPGSSYHPCQTSPPSTLVGFGGHRLGYLFHPLGWSPSFWEQKCWQSHLPGSPMVVHCDQSSWSHGCSDRSWCL
jgi:hypothetical protein